MKKSVLKSIALMMVVAFFISLMSSCNKGYGCPNQFSADKVINVI